jgi:hypothetical protein
MKLNPEIRLRLTGGAKEQGSNPFSRSDGSGIYWGLRQPPGGNHSASKGLSVDFYQAENDSW